MDKCVIVQREPVLVSVVFSDLDVLPSSERLHCLDAKDQVKTNAKLTGTQQVSLLTSPFHLNTLQKRIKNPLFVQKLLECLPKAQNVNAIFCHVKGSNDFYKLPVDRIGGWMSQSLINERAICHTAMSYLSSLGGAYSSLGNCDPHFAKSAKKTTLHQARIALKLDDKVMCVRVSLYFALNMIQEKKFAIAHKIINSQAKFVHAEGYDVRVAKMWHGVRNLLLNVQYSN